MVANSAPAKPGDRAGDDEAQELVRVGVEAERARARLVPADRLQHAAERRAREPQQKEIGDDQHRHAEVIENRPPLEIENRDAPERDHRLDVDVGAVRAAGDARVVEQREQHLPEGERHHDEIEAAREHRERADHGGGQAASSIAAGKATSALAALAGDTK